MSGCRIGRCQRRTANRILHRSGSYEPTTRELFAKKVSLGIFKRIRTSFGENLERRLFGRRAGQFGRVENPCSKAQRKRSINSAEDKTSRDTKILTQIMPQKTNPTKPQASRSNVLQSLSIQAGYGGHLHCFFEQTCFSCVQR